MSQEYLDRILNTPEHRVQGECGICLEPYNTMNTTTGVIEAEIRVSCGHTFGSSCIVTWLRDNNSCPFCRNFFFPRQPRPYLEHGLMDIGRENTGRINATGLFTREPNVIRPVTVPASSELEAPANLRSRVFDAGRQMHVRLPTGSEVPRSSPIGDSGPDRSSTVRDTARSEMTTGSDTRNSNAGRSNTVRVPTGSVGASTVPDTNVITNYVRYLSALNMPPSTRSEALRDSIASGLRDLDIGRPIGLPTESEIPANRVAILPGPWEEAPSEITNVAASLSALMPVDPRCRGSAYVGAVCYYMASHLLDMPSSVEEVLSAREVPGANILRPAFMRFLYRLVYPIRRQLINADNLVLIARNRLEGMLAFLPPPDGALDDGEEWIRAAQEDNEDISPQQLITETYDCSLAYYGYFGGRNTYYICMDICQSGLIERHLGVRYAQFNVAIGLYIATHLLGTQVSYERISDCTGVYESGIRAGYARIHPWANQLLRPSWLYYIGQENMSRALEAVPALNWPPLEAWSPDEA